MKQTKASFKRHNRSALGMILLVSFFFIHTHSTAAQVGPAEIKNVRLRTLEQQYLQDLVALHQSILAQSFAFKLSLNRHLGLDPKDQIDADARGLEFVVFHERELLKVTANYNAAYNSATLTPNQRAGQVLNDVILPILRLLPDRFSSKDSFDGFGFEIGYHVITHKKSYQYEGKESLVAVFDKTDGLQYASSKDDERQIILNRSDIYLNGEPFGLAIGAKIPFEPEALVRRPVRKSATTVANIQPEAPPIAKATVPATPSVEPSAKVIPVKSSTSTADSATAKTNVDALREKYQSTLDILHGEGTAKFSFVDYAPPAFVVIRNDAALQATLRNPDSFDRDSTSIYKRAARAFDLFLAPRLKWIVSKIPDTDDFSSLDLSVVNELISVRSEKSSEAIEFIFPLKETRKFTAADITNQELIDRSIILVNGIRIALNLAQVE